MPFHEDFIFTKFRENETLMKISEFTEIEGLVHIKFNYTRMSILGFIFQLPDCAYMIVSRIIYKQMFFVS